ncbi:MAG: exodeoxyribonuclease VII large subunit [Gammaproteobacteria bacterium]|nr:exodeoxyribonuclease VII large subunit [Gammaproteobacteria bacterium]
MFQSYVCSVKMFFLVGLMFRMTTNIFSVTELNARVRALLEIEMGAIAVTGEISNLVQAGSGHYYFTLKDSKAQVKCAYFINAHRNTLKHQLQNGLEVMVYGKISLYEPRGDYQLIVSHIQDTGIGLLYQQYVLLKNKLEAMGLFASEHKQAIPLFPQKIAIVTSPKGAALHDILTTLRRRYPLAETCLYPTDVQGNEAPKQIIQALNKADMSESDVILLCRGGGSLEDLWAFNDEQLAHTIHACRTPIISGVGHETDFTIADFVADYRAATPTAAAEKATPNQLELKSQILQWQNRLIQKVMEQVQQYQTRLSWFNRTFEQPEKLLTQAWQRLDYAQRLFKEYSGTALKRHLHRHQLLEKQLEKLNPRIQLSIKQQRLVYLQTQLQQHLLRYIEIKQQKHHLLSQQLHTLGPASTLDRGYAIVTNQQKHVLTHAREAKLHETISIRLAHGQIQSQVQHIQEN